MTTLNLRERELVALGAALAANCIPCVEHHVPEARKAGLSDDEIRQALELADGIKRVPAQRILEAAGATLGISIAPATPASAECGARPAAAAQKCC